MLLLKIQVFCIKNCMTEENKQLDLQWRSIMEYSV